MSTQLAVREELNVADLRQTAQLLAMSGFFEAKGSGEQAVAQLATKILAGREMGFGPYASVNGIHIIQGKPTVSANLMAAAVKASGRYDYRVRQMDDAACKIEFFQRAGDKMESIGVSSFSAEDAKKAGTQNLQKFARNMLFARAMSNGVRWYCPDVFMAGSVYTPEEMGATVDVETGEIIEAEVRRMPEPDKPAPNGNGRKVQPKPEPEPEMPSDNLRKQFHATGMELYGDKATWDAKRGDLVRWVTNKRTGSSKELTAEEMAILIEKLNDKLRENAYAQPALIDAPAKYN
jgi:hypothetical protein